MSTIYCQYLYTQIYHHCQLYLHSFILAKIIDFKKCICRKERRRYWNNWYYRSMLIGSNRWCGYWRNWRYRSALFGSTRWCRLIIIFSSSLLKLSLLKLAYYKCVCLGNSINYSFIHCIYSPKKSLCAWDWVIIEAIFGPKPICCCEIIKYFHSFIHSFIQVEHHCQFYLHSFFLVKVIVFKIMYLQYII